MLKKKKGRTPPYRVESLLPGANRNPWASRNVSLDKMYSISNNEKKGCISVRNKRLISLQ